MARKSKKPAAPAGPVDAEIDPLIATYTRKATIASVLAGDDTTRQYLLTIELLQELKLRRLKETERTNA